MASIRVQDLHKSYGDVRVIDDINVMVDDGSFVVFVGPSGCGKSTLLRTITGLEPHDSGRIYLGDTDITDLPPGRRNLAMVFQNYALYPHMTVRKNIGFGLRVAGVDKETINHSVTEVARSLGLENHLDRKPTALSGGQRQRVAIGRAIVQSPSAFLFDEPLSNLDAALRIGMRRELIELHNRLEKTMIYVTHDQTEAMTMADLIVVLNSGHVEQTASPVDIFDRPVNEFVASFIGAPQMNFFDVESTDDGLRFKDGTTIPFDDRIRSANRRIQRFGIRPENIDYNTERGLFSGSIKLVEQLGSDALLHVDVPQLGTIRIRGVSERRFKTGDTIKLSPQTRQAHLFDDNRQAILADDT